MDLSIISIIINTVLSVLTITVAVIALFQTHKQVNISNKQSLFKERTNAFIQLSSLMEIYGGNKSFVDDSEEIPELTFHLLANNKMLESVVEVVYNPLKNKEQNNFLIKMEELRALSTEVSLLWECEEAIVASQFILSYVQILLNLYRQAISISNFKKATTRLNLSEFKKVVKESAEKTGLNKATKDIALLHSQMIEKDVLNVLKEQIKLK